MHILAIAGAIRRHAAPAFCALLLLLTMVLWLCLKAEQRHATKLQRRLIVASAAIDQQNAMIKALNAEGVRRQALTKAALAEARSANARHEVQAEALRASARLPRPPGSPCTISETLRNAKGL